MNSFPHCWFWLYSFLSLFFFLAIVFLPTILEFGIVGSSLMGGLLCVCCILYLSIWHFTLGFSWTTRVPSEDQIPVAAGELNSMVILGTVKLITECWGLVGYYLQWYIYTSLCICHSLMQQSGDFSNLLFQMREPHLSPRFQAINLVMKPCFSWSTLQFPFLPNNVFQWKPQLGFITKTLEAPNPEWGGTTLAGGARPIYIFP